MRDRRELIAAVEARLSRVAATHDLAPVLGDAALSEAEELAAILADDQVDLQARYLLGWLYWNRAQALPTGQGDRDRTVVIDMFTPASSTASADCLSHCCLSSPITRSPPP